MIVSHRAPSSLNMSSYRAIWTHFRPNSIFFINLILQLLASGTCSRQIHDRFPIDPQYIHDRCIIIRCLWNPCDKDFRILDLLEPLRQRFQNFGPARTLASKISEFWTCWNPCVKDFRIVDPNIWVKNMFRNLTPKYGGTIIATPSKIVKSLTQGFGQVQNSEIFDARVWVGPKF